MGWKRLWRDLIGPDTEFVSLDPVVIEREWRRGVELVHRLDVRLLNRVIEAKGKV